MVSYETGTAYSSAGFNSILGGGHVAHLLFFSVERFFFLGSFIVLCVLPNVACVPALSILDFPFGALDL